MASTLPRLASGPLDSDHLHLAIRLLASAETVGEPLPLVVAARTLLEEIAPRWGTQAQLCAKELRNISGLP